MSDYIKRVAEKILQKELSNQKIIIVLGARQVGKTTLIKNALATQKSCFLNLDISLDIARLKAAASLSPTEAKRMLGNPDFLVIDEAQRLPETTRFIKGWYDEKIPLKIILLGSSSLDLLNQAAESLTGRNHKLFLPPLLFKEQLALQDWYQGELESDTLQESFAEPLKTKILQAMVFGAYPEATCGEDAENYLLNLSNDYLLKDVLQSGILRAPAALKGLLVYLAHHLGEETSTLQLAENTHLSRQTVERYLDLLEETFVIFRLNPFFTGHRSEINKAQKFYFWDNGVRNALLKEFNLSPFRSDVERLWQNWAICEIAKQNLLEGNKSDLYFWRTRDGSSLELVVKDTHKLSAYKIRWNSIKNRDSVLGRAFTQQYGVTVEPITPSQLRPIL
jgi:predicted AAA+ superfamily ATPase